MDGRGPPALLVDAVEHRAPVPDERGDDTAEGRIHLDQAHRDAQEANRAEPAFQDLESRLIDYAQPHIDPEKVTRSRRLLDSN